MTRPLSPAILTTFALALVDDAAVSDTCGRTLSAALARPHRAADAEAGDSGPAASTDATTTEDEGWSAAFVQHAGYWSHFDHRLGTSVWPLPHRAGCNELAAFAARHFVLAADEPEAGDIYLLWSPAKKRFVRAGILLSRSRRFRYPSGGKRYECLTIDGDTNRDGALRGSDTAVVHRVLSPSSGDRLIRWTLLDVIAIERTWTDELPLRRAA